MAFPSETLPLFVYGTLRRGGRYHNDYLAGRFDRVEVAQLPGFRKTVGSHGFDVAEPDPEGVVAGELFFLSRARADSVLAGCDELEELPPGELRGALYQRIDATVRFGDGECRAWVYVAP